MDDAQVQRIINDPGFIKMARKKTNLGGTFSIITLMVYFGYLLLVGFNKALLSTPIAIGKTATIGVYAGFFIIIFTVVITAIYVVIANGEFDVLTKKVVEDINSGKI